MEIINAFDEKQKRMEMKPYSKVRQLDEQESLMLAEWLAAPTVEITYEPDDERDFAILWMHGGTRYASRARVVNVNGIQWNIPIGKSFIPQPLYEYLMTVEDMRKEISRIPTGVNLGTFVR